jgi:hypothetical protein
MTDATDTADRQVLIDISDQYDPLINLTNQADNPLTTGMINYLQTNELPVETNLAKSVILQASDYVIRNGQLFHLARVSAANSVHGP